MRWKPHEYILYTTLIGVWSAIGAVVISGPGAIQTPDRGPYFGISGFWCWIADNYPAERIALEYLFMFFSAGTAFILYSLVFLRMRGNLIVNGWRIRFRYVDSSMAWKLHTGRDVVDKLMMTVTKQMLWYPVSPRTRNLVKRNHSRDRTGCIYDHSPPYRCLPISCMDRPRRSIRSNNICGHRLCTRR